MLYSIKEFFNFDVEENKGDVGTADFLTGLIQKHEEAAWMLRSLAR